MAEGAANLALVWERDLILSGQADRGPGTPTVRITLDSEAVAGPSPVQALAFSLAACMAMDVLHILTRGRHELRGLRVDLAIARTPDHPKRLTAVELRFTITGDVPADSIQRAIDLSREKYCSVWHSLRPDIDLKSTFTVSPGL